MGDRISGIMEDDNPESSLSIKELKKLLGDRGVDYRDCVEKKDLVTRAIATRDRDKPSLRSWEEKIGNLDCLLSSNKRTVDWILVILHGFGANSADLAPIGR